MKRGYARVSTKEQNLGRQVKKLKEIGCQKVYEDTYTGGSRNRPSLELLLKEIQMGDEIWIIELSRFSRSLKDMLELVQEITDKGATLHSVNEKWLDTSDDNPSAKFLLNIFASLAEFERAMIKNRQQDGIAFAKEKGIYKGRPKSYTEKNPSIIQALEWFKEGKKPIKEITQITKVSKSTLYRIAQEKGIKRGEKDGN